MRIVSVQVGRPAWLRPVDGFPAAADPGPDAGSRPTPAPGAARAADAPGDRRSAPPRPGGGGHSGVLSGIVKTAVRGPVRIVRHRVEGDGQADRRVHGGRDKAVYAYPEEHLAFWRRRFPGAALVPGSFGENLTLSGLLEGDARVGDLYRIGTAALRVTQPRLPCGKLVLHLRNLCAATGTPADIDGPEFQREFVRSGRTGFYLAVETEGALQAGDEVVRIEAGEGGLTVAEAARLHRVGVGDPEGVRRALACPHLPDAWADRFRETLRRVGGEESP